MTLDRLQIFMAVSQLGHLAAAAADALNALVSHAVSGMESGVRFRYSPAPKAA